MSTLVTRRRFLAFSAGAVAIASTFRPASSADAGRDPEPLGPVAGRTGPAGLAPGTPAEPSQGSVILLDGRRLVASHTTRWRIGPGKSVLLAPEPDGCWSVLYAEC